MYIRAYRTNGYALEMADYEAIDRLSFAPSADLVGASVPINEFEADIHTEDDIAVGAYAELYDDRQRLWAAYWVSYAEHIAAGVLRLRARSDIALLDRVTMDAVYYNERPVTRVLDQIMGEAVSVPYTLDERLAGETITGFCPKQTARQRLLWVCFAIGGYVKACFNARVEILAMDDTAKVIPLQDTYWKPSLTYGDWVTGIRATAYSFEAGEPERGDEYVESVTGVKYIVTKSTVTLSNPEAPAAAPENIVDVDGVYLVNPQNVSAVLSRLSQWYFGRTEMDLACVDNGDFLPGNRVTAYADGEAMVTGYVTRATFAFGLQAKAALKLTAVETLPCARLVIDCVFGEIRVGRMSFTFPVGYAYAVENPWLDVALGGVRYILRPGSATAEGVIQAGENVNTQGYAEALALEDGVLTITSVDAIEEQEETGVIS